MQRAASRPAGRIIAAGCAAGCVLSIGALATVSTDAMLAQAFDRPASGLSTTTRVARDEPVVDTQPAARLWLSREDVRAPLPGVAMIGERLSLVVDGGQQMTFEVVSISELVQQPGAPAGERLVMVTCREVGEGERAGRVVRLIVDADAPLSVGLSRPGQRAL